MIHILLDPSASGSLKYVLSEIGLDRKEKIFSFFDIFSIGPIWKLHEKKGLEFRIEWMKKCISDEYDEILDYKLENVLNQINLIPDRAHITIWTSDNAHEQTGLRYLLYLLKGKKVDITIVNTTRAYEELFHVSRDKYSFFHTGVIAPEKLQVIYEKDYGELLTEHNREEIEKEWYSLAKSKKTLRIWRNGLIQNVAEDYYDELIIDRAKQLHGKRGGKEFIESTRLIGEVLGHIDQYVGDAFLEYRLKSLIESEVFESEGSLETIRLYSVRLKKNIEST